MLGLDIKANLCGLIVHGNIGFCQFHISWLSKSLEEEDDAAAEHFSFPHTQLVFCTSFISSYLVSIDVLMSLASQIPFKQENVQYNATHLFSFDSSPLSSKQRWHISHRDIVAFHPDCFWLSYLTCSFSRGKRLSGQSLCCPFSLKSCSDASMRMIHSFPQIKGGHF